MGLDKDFEEMNFVKYSLYQTIELDKDFERAFPKSFLLSPPSSQLDGPNLELLLNYTNVSIVIEYG